MPSSLRPFASTPRLLALLAAVATLAAVAAPPASARVPQGWVGTFVSADESAKPGRSTREWNRRVTAGAQAARVSFVWGQLQPYASYNSRGFPHDSESSFTPGVGNVPTRFGISDAVVRAAARRGIRLLPVVLQAPGWAAARHPHDTVAIPKSNKTYANFLRTLVRRYGPNGSFWSDNPDLTPRPIRQWQAWNEPNIPRFWGGNPRTWRDQYVRLLKAAHDGIKREDRGAKVILAGLSNYAHARAWRSLDQIYNNRVYNRRTMRGLFDQAAVHPYTLLTRNVVRIARYMRDVMNRNGDGRKQQTISELSWPSSKLPNGHDRAARNGGFNVTESDQARKIGSVYPMLAHYRNTLRIASVYWYTWLSSNRGRGDAFNWAGLRAFGGRDTHAKPAYFTWAKVVRRLEGCRNVAKRSATRCG